MKFGAVVVVSLFMSVSTVATADDELEGRNRFSMYGGLGQASIDGQKAFAGGVEDSALYIRLGMEFQRSSWLYGVGISGLIYDDNADFSQTVQDQFGNISTADSSAEAFDLYGEFGYRYLLATRAYLDFITGYEQMLTSGRSISNCSNCYDEDIDIDSGFYLMPRLQFETEGGFTFSLLYRQYFTGDLESAVVFAIGKST
jgi:hypothetical protein